MIKKWVRILGLGIGLTIFLSQIYQSILSISTLSIRMDWGWIILGFLAMFLLIALQIFIWKQILNAMEIPLEYLQIAKGYTLSLIPRYIPGSVWGYLNRSEWLNEQYHVPVSQGNVSSLLEVLQVILTAFMALIIFSGVLSGFSFWRFSLVLLLVLLLPILVWKILSLPSILRNRWIPFKIRLSNWLIAVYSGLIQWVILGLSTISLLFGIQGVFTFESLSLQKGALVSFCYTTSWLAGFFVLFIPGGMGIRELSLSFFLTHLVNVPVGFSTWIAVLSRLLYSLAELTWIFLSLHLKSSPQKRINQKGLT